jgi:hypothetical protein
MAPHLAYFRDAEKSISIDTLLIFVEWNAKSYRHLAHFRSTANQQLPAMLPKFVARETNSYQQPCPISWHGKPTLASNLAQVRCTENQRLPAPLPISVARQTPIAAGSVPFSVARQTDSCQHLAQYPAAPMQLQPCPATVVRAVRRQD